MKRQSNSLGKMHAAFCPSYQEDRSAYSCIWTKKHFAQMYFQPSHLLYIKLIFICSRNTMNTLNTTSTRKLICKLFKRFNGHHLAFVSIFLPLSIFTGCAGGVIHWQACRLLSDLNATLLLLTWCPGRLGSSQGQISIRPSSTSPWPHHTTACRKTEMKIDMLPGQH